MHRCNTILGLNYVEHHEFSPLLMALPAQLQSGLLPSEVEYLATSTTDVQIVPLTSIDKARFLSGVYGPFRPPQRTKVPLWLALNLKRKGKCYVVPPDWMLAENLKNTLHAETTTLAFAQVPFHYVSIAKVILDVASDDVPQADEVRAMLKDLREARQSKISEGLSMLNPYHLEMTNISYSELCELRPFFSTAFSNLRSMRVPSAAGAGAGDPDASGRIPNEPPNASFGGGGYSLPSGQLRDDSQHSASGNDVAQHGNEADDDDDGMGVAEWRGR